MEKCLCALPRQNDNSRVLLGATNKGVDPGIGDEKSRGEATASICYHCHLALHLLKDNPTRMHDSEGEFQNSLYTYYAYE